MPLFEYRCRSCGSTFERLIRAHVPETPRCPSCQGGDLERLLSAFAVDSDASRQRNLERGREVAKKTTRDQQMAVIEYERDHIHGHDH